MLKRAKLLELINNHNVIGKDIMKKVKTEAKPSFIKTPVNVKKLVRKFIAKPIAYIVLLTSSAYGIRKLLETIQDPIAIGLTILFVLGLAFILFDTND